MKLPEHRSMHDLQSGLDDVRAAPASTGTVELIVRRPAEEQREVLAKAELCSSRGLVGDNWLDRGSPRTADKSAHPDMQLNIMNARAAALIAGSKAYWPTAGDQLYIDMDLSESNMPAGTRLSLGTAVIEITDQPHLGCLKFKHRFGEDALQWVNSDVGRQLHLRGVNARVISDGVVSEGDQIQKL